MKHQSHQRILKTVFYYIAFIGLGLASGVLGPSLLRLADNTGSTIGQVSSIFIFYSFGYMAGSFFSGRGYDRFRGHPIMAFTLVIMAVCLALTPIIGSLWVLMAILFLLGASQGGLDVGANTLLVWVHGSQNGPYMNGLHLFFGVGAFVSPILVAQSVRVGDNLNLAYWIMTVFMLIPALGLFLIQSPAQALDPHDPEKPSGRSSVLLLGMIVAFFIFYVGMESGFTGWIFTYASTSGLLDETYAAYANALFWGMFTLGRLLAIPISIKLPPRRVLLLDLVGCLVSVLVLLLWQQSVNALWLAIAGTGLFAASIFPSMISFAENRMHLSGGTTSLFFVGASVGGMFFPWLIGQFYESIGPRMVPITISASLVLLMTLYVVLLKGFPRKESEIRE